MHRNWLKRIALSVVALTLTLTGCEKSGHLLSPSAQPENLVVSGFTVLKESPAATGSFSKVIDQNGGELAFGPHRLTVPVGAVDAPTTFTITRSGNDLLATFTATRATTNDVGAAGFAKPVTVTFSYQNVLSLESAAKLKLIWIKPDGTAEVQTTTVDTNGKLVHGQVGHFSDYALASD